MFTEIISILGLVINCIIIITIIVIIDNM